MTRDLSGSPIDARTLRSRATATVVPYRPRSFPDVDLPRLAGGVTTAGLFRATCPVIALAPQQSDTRFSSGVAPGATGARAITGPVVVLRRVAK
jgi:hypothetical protein